MRKKFLHKQAFLLFALLVFFLAGASTALPKSTSAAKSLMLKADTCRKALYRSGKKMRYRHNWLNCINKYLRVAKRYPSSDEAAWSLYRSARMFTKLYRYSGKEQDLDEAIDLYRKVIGKYPKHRLADDAQYRIGEIYLIEKKDYSHAYVEFLKVDIKFPKGDMRPKARSKLKKLAAILNKRGHREKAAPSKAKGLVKVENIRHWSTPTYTRVVIDLERPTKFEFHLLKEDRKHKKPRRLYLDLKNTYVSSEIDSPIQIMDGLLRSARAAQYTKNSVRVVLDIKNIEGYKVFHLYDPFRIVVDVRGSKKEPEQKSVSKLPERSVRKGIRKVKKPDNKISLARQLGLNVRRIVIDPGHGGKDPGCFYSGSGKIREKDITLRLAKILARKIEQKLHCQAILTRQKDVFLPLEKRTAFANVKKADLFISLHVNAHKQRGVHGLETYFLNMATDERAVLVAARENATSRKNISDLQKILNDLILNTKINESSRLAYDVEKGMVGKLKKKYRNVKELGVKQAPFYVLIGAEMPAVLVETGFITNPMERRRLASTRYLENLADGIVSGISSYINSINRTYSGG